MVADHAPVAVVCQWQQTFISSVVSEFLLVYFSGKSAAISPIKLNLYVYLWRLFIKDGMLPPGVFVKQEVINKWHLLYYF